VTTAKVGQHTKYENLDDLELSSAQPGQCRVCFCTEESPCLNWITHGPCAWANGDMTLCDSPVCIIIDFQRRILGWDV
jgi:hypothetical protein